MQGKILVLDGVSTNRIMLKVQLSAACYDIAQGDRLAGVTALLRQTRPDMILTAMTLGQRFGILSILSKSIPRHMRYVGAMGVMDRLAGDMPLQLGVLDLADRDRTFDRLKTVGTRLRDEAMADVLILGCAGMTAYRTDLEDHLGLPVVEPCQAATAMAIGRVALQKTN